MADKDKAETETDVARRAEKFRRELIIRKALDRVVTRNDELYPPLPFETGPTIGDHFNLTRLMAEMAYEIAEMLIEERGGR